MRKLETKTSATFTTTKGDTISIENFLEGIYGEVFSGIGSTEDKAENCGKDAFSKEMAGNFLFDCQISPVSALP